MTSNQGPTFAIRLTATENQRLEEMAAEAGLSKSKLAAHLLEELLPTIESVRTRLQVNRKATATAR